MIATVLWGLMAAIVLGIFIRGAATGVAKFQGLLIDKSKNPSVYYLVLAVTLLGFLLFLWMAIKPHLAWLSADVGQAPIVLSQMGE